MTAAEAFNARCFIQLVYLTVEAKWRKLCIENCFIPGEKLRCRGVVTCKGSPPSRLGRAHLVVSATSRTMRSWGFSKVEMVSYLVTDLELEQGCYQFVAWSLQRMGAS